MRTRSARTRFRPTCDARAPVRRPSRPAALAHLVPDSVKRLKCGESVRPSRNRIGVITSGVLAVWVTHIDGETGVVEMLGANRLVENGVADICTVEHQAVSRVTLMEIDVERAYAEGDVLRYLCEQRYERLNRLRLWAACQQRANVEDRLWGVLHLLAEEFAIDVSMGKVIDLPLTHHLLAASIGSTRSTVTRLIGRLIEERRLGQIAIPGGRRYFLPDIRPWVGLVS